MNTSSSWKSTATTNLKTWWVICRYIALILCIIPVTAVALAFDNPSPSGTVRLTAEERSWLKAHPEKLTLFFNTKFPPIEFISESGSFTGMGADVVSCIESLLGINFVTTPMDDWNRHLAALKRGECAVAPTIVRTAGRETYTFFTKPYATVPVVIITTPTTSAQITLNDLTKRRVGVVSGYATETYLRKIAVKNRFELVTVPNVSEGLRSTSFGQIDAFVENLAVAAYYIELEGIPNLQVAGTTDYEFAWCLGVSRKYPLLFSAISKALEQISPNEMTAIHKKWITIKVNFKMDSKIRRNFILTVLFSILLLTVLTGITIFLKWRLNKNIAGFKESEEKYRLLFDNAVEGVFQTTPDGRFLSANPSLVRILGFNSVGEIFNHFKDIGKQHYLNSEDRKTFQRIMESNGGTSDFEVQLRKRDGSLIWANIKARIIRDKTGKIHHFEGFLEDITERKNAEKALRESEERYRTILNEMSEGYHEVDLAGNFTFFNEAFLKLFGYSSDEMMGTHFSRYAANEAIKKKVYQTYHDIYKKDTPVQRAEWDIIRKDGQRRTLEYYAALVKNSKNIPKGFRGIVRDITKRKQAEAEKERLQDQLLQAQKMESIGRLAGGVAHDYNNMLNVILGHTELALMKVDEDHDLYYALKEIQTAATRSANITKQLLAYARKQTISLEQLNLNDTVESMLNMLRRLIGEDINLAWKPAGDLWTVKIDPSQIDQILVNLCVNSRDAISGVGKLTIETGMKVFDSADCALHAGFVPGDFVMLAVSDNGCGMDKDTLDNMFEPFFTTKEVGKGTGLGLATVYGIVKQNNGFINVYSEPGHGSTFKIYLPRFFDDDYVATAVPEKKTAASGTETILLVEDELMILEMTTNMLQKLGYTVLVASSPSDAIRLAKDHTSTVHLLMTDVVMPEMNGRELSEHLQSLYPDLKILFMSGYTADVIAHRGVLNNEVFFISKPFSKKDIAVKIRKVLDDV